MASLIIDLSQYNKTSSKDWIFKDFKNPLDLRADKADVIDSKDYAAIENSISNIFLFVPGENIVFPDFGNSLYKYVYEPINETTTDAIRNEIITIFKVWEPRVRIVSLDIIEIRDENTIYIQMIYTVPMFNDARTLQFNVGIRRGE